MLIFIKDLNCTLRLFMSMTQFYLASCRDRGGKDCWLRVFLLELQTVRALSVIVKTDGSFAALVPIDRIWGSIIRGGALNPLYGSWAQGEWWLVRRCDQKIIVPRPRDQNKSGRNIPCLGWAGQHCTGGWRVMVRQHATEADTTHWHQHRQAWCLHRLKRTNSVIFVSDMLFLELSWSDLLQVQNAFSRW